MTLKNLFALGLLGVSLVACVPKATPLATTSTATTGTGGGAASCAALGAYSTLALCKQTTSAQCFPSDKNILGNTTTCYFAVDGSSACANTPATWSYGAWGSWCIPTGMPRGIYQQTRTATCMKTLSTCDCAADAQASNFCAIGSTLYPPCSFTTPPVINCSGAPTPTPTPVPTPTPSQSLAWCGNINLNYASTDSNGVSLSHDINSYHYGEIVSYFRNAGYGIQYIRAASNGTSPIAPRITTAERENNFTVQITASKSRCTFGNKVGIHVELFRGNGTGRGDASIAQHSSYSSCIHTGDVGGRMLTDALNSINAPSCY